MTKGSKKKRQARKKGSFRKQMDKKVGRCREPQYPGAQCVIVYH